MESRAPVKSAIQFDISVSLQLAGKFSDMPVFCETTRGFVGLVYYWPIKWPLESRRFFH